MNGLIGGLLIATSVSGCGGVEAATPQPQRAKRSIAETFAVALLHGDARRARALLMRPDEEAVVFLVRRAATPWKAQHASVQFPARRAGDSWIVSYAGTHSYRDGRFEEESGRLVVFVATTSGGERVRFFFLTHVRRRFSTHDDAQLLPSNR